MIAIIVVNAVKFRYFLMKLDDVDGLFCGFPLKKKTLTSFFNHRPRQTTDQVHDEEADH